MAGLRDDLDRVAEHVAAYRESLGDTRVGAVASRDDIAAALPSEIPDTGLEPGAVIDELIRVGTPGTVTSSGPRYFGFVTGGVVDAALLADMVTTGWDQFAFNEASSPAGLAFEDVAGAWLKQLLGIPATASVGFVTGAQGGNTVGLAAGRLKVLHDHGWDVGRDGLNGAPAVRVVAGAERHGTIDRSLRLLGLGDASLELVPARADGAMDATALASVLDARPPGPTIVCAQAGNVNTGAFDDLRTIADVAHERGAWVHVDGAFGLWVGASRSLAHHVEGIELADSWVCDGHKWLNVPYDAGYAFCAHPAVHASAMGYTAAYLTGQDDDRHFGGGDFVPESSRRARGFATWAALRSLGREGVEEIVDRCCALARRFAAGLDDVDGVEVVNDVVINQVLVRVGDEEFTDRVADAIRAGGEAWLGATTWRGERLLRISVSNWSTTEQDIDRSVRAIAAALRVLA